MPRIARKNLNSNYIHIMTQGIEKTYIFEEGKYKKYYIELLYKNLRNYNSIEIIAYCIMDNHAHILIYCEDIKELSKWMNQINTSYGLWYNRGKEREGYVFKNRYKTQAIKDRKHLFNAIAYIHQNPVKAKMVSKLDEYLYSSYLLYETYKMPKRVIQLVFDEENYMEIFKKIHKNYKEEDMLEIEKEKLSNDKIKILIESFCKRNNITCKILRENNHYLRLLVEEIKSEGKIKNNELSKYLGIGKNRISYIFKKEKNKD